MIYLILIVMLMLQGINLADLKAQKPDEDKTLSPYFLVLSKDSQTEQLPLYSTSADVNIVGVIADVTVRQVYKNNGKTPIEAIYVFPASTKAAVYAMSMKIGQRLLVAEIQKKEEARKTYENAIKEGKSASLLEQHKPNVFQMNVGNIMPGDTIVVEMKYTELLIPDNKVYEFVYPTVVGPRYSNVKDSNAKPEDRFVETPYQRQGEKPLYKFDINVSIDAGMPIEGLMCESHKIVTEKIGTNSLNIKLGDSETFSGNKDFVLNYRLAGDKIKTGLILSKGYYENFFLLMLQPPKRVENKDIPPREYIFIIDVSGSMHGFPLDVSKDMMKKLFNKLRPGDKFNILLFSGSASFLSEESVEATQSNIDKAMDLITKQSGYGGTELLPALKSVFKLPKKEGYSRTIAILTDGYVAVEEEAIDLIKNNLNQANVFAFGIGKSVNRYLIEGLARAGQGEAFISLDQKSSEILADKFYKYIESPIMTDIVVNYSNFTVYDVEPITVPDVLSDRPIIIFGKWKGEPNGEIEVIGTAGKTKLKVNIPVNAFSTIDTSQALKYLWARKRIEMISDYNTIMLKKERIGEITDIGLKYNLLTNYTSFVAVDYLIRNQGDSVVKVKQALPLPEGVSDYAVGSEDELTQTIKGLTNYRLAAPPPSPNLGGSKMYMTKKSELRAEEKDVLVPGTVVEPESFDKSYTLTANSDGTYQTASGVKITEIKKGTGNTVKIGDKVTVHYKIFIENGKKIEDTYKNGKPLTFIFGKDKVFKGIQDAIIEMQKGGKRTARIPASDIFYKENNKYKKYKNKILVIEVELIDIK